MRNFTLRSRTICGWAALSLALAVSQANAADSISFNRDIRPIFSDTCFKCHGPDANARKGKLRLDTPEGATENRGGYFAIDPGNAEESEAVLRIYQTDPKELMPPPDSGKSLTDAQKALIKQWIAEGAKYEPHWAYIAPKQEKLPAKKRVTPNPIDAFVHARLKQEGLEPAPEVDPVRLLRRVSFDLTGLPPSPADVDAFLKAPKRKRYEDAVDRLLASPHYGERMAQEWFDVVRFADTTGYHSDDYRDMSPYRDYVITSYNDNMPFDQFTIEQLAGDLLPNATQEQIIASGYNRLNQITSEGGAQPKEYLAKYMADRVRNLGSVWMGATLGCAECHDHKFDPFTTKNFYELGSFFADIEEPGKYEHGSDFYAPVLFFPTPEQDEALAKLEAEKAEAMKLPQSTEEEKKTRREATRAVDGKIRALRDETLSTLVTKTVTPREIHVLPRGNWLDESGAVVTPATPTFLPAMHTKGERATRLDLAEWLVSKDNPLTARTVVNRLWAQFFGKGLAPVLDDLGHQSRAPSYPELLDWLSVEFVSSGWDIKYIVRLIVTSDTYRQSTQRSAAAIEHDPGNLLLAGQNARRLPAEMVRDNALSVAGLIDLDMGGRSAKPYQPEGYYKDTYLSVGKPHIYTADAGAQQYRRGIYTFWKRTFPHPMLLAFDAPTREECTAERVVSNTPQQALTLLNDPSYVESANAFAARIVAEGGKTTESRLQFATKRALSRMPTAHEVEILSGLYARQHEAYAAAPQDAQTLLNVGQWRAPKGSDLVELAAWTQVARVLLNTQETITRY